MSLTESERERLSEILSENRKTAFGASPPISEEHGVVDRVREIVDEFEEQGKLRFKAREIAPRTDHNATTVGLALGYLAEEGRVESLRDWSPRVWRIRS